jgi:shikimate kinase
LSFDQIVLAGPIAAGKSALGLVVADRLGLPCYSADRMKSYFYYRRGYDELAARRAQERGGTLGRAAGNKPHDLYAVERMLREFHHCVLDLGAGHACYLDPALLAEARHLFAPLENSFLILPARDPERSLALLAERIRGRASGVDGAERTASLLELNRTYLAHPSYSELTKTPIYVEGRGIAEVAAEIAGRVRHPPHPELSRDLDLLILVGPNGVGKTTLGRCIAGHLGYRFLPVEEFWLARYASIDEIYSRLPEAYSRFEAHVRQVLATTGSPVVFESGGRNPCDVELIRSLSSSYRTLLVKVTADLETCLRRVRMRGTAGNFPKSPEYVRQCHRDFHATFEPRYEFALEVVNGDLSEEEIRRIFGDFERGWKAAPEAARRGCRVRGA